MEPPATAEATKVLELNNMIDGEFSAPAEGEMEDVVNPANGEVIARAPLSTAADLDKAVAAARKAFEEWSVTTPGERQALLLKLADAFEERGEEIADLEAADAGKPRASVIEEEVPPMVDQLRFFAGAARCMEGKPAGEYMQGYTSMIRREPIGVCGQITPWNYPLMMAVWKIGPALATGNTLVLKPAETTPVTTLKFLAELCAEIFPKGVANFVGGHGEDTGAGLVTHDDVDFISLTGSPETGKWIAKAASDTLKRVHLELGGKAPVVVFDDVDMETAMETIAGTGYFNAGQDCTAATRVLAAKGVYDDVVSGLAEQAKDYKTGDTFDPDTVLGPLNSERQRERVEGFLEGKPKEAEIVVGGKRPDLPGYFLEATVVSGPGQDSDMIQKEIFGPVITVQQFDDEAKAIEWANGTRYGLSASVWTRDIGRAMRVSNALRFGCVWINDHIPLVAEMPHGGYKQSGYGKDLSMYSLEDYTNVKHVMANIS
jgi:betaine-aldehyde dehydrogenase